MDPVTFHRELMRLLKLAEKTGEARDKSVAAGFIERAVEEWTGDRIIVNVEIGVAS